jgi:hypothetical protein
MSREELIRKLGFISTVVIPVLTLAITSTLAYLKEDNTNKSEEKIDK